MQLSKEEADNLRELEENRAQRQAPAPAQAVPPPMAGAPTLVGAIAQSAKKKQTAPKQNPIKNIAVDGFLALLILPFPYIHLKSNVRWIFTFLQGGTALTGGKMPMPTPGPLSQYLGGIFPSWRTPLSPMEKVFVGALNSVAPIVYTILFVGIFGIILVAGGCELASSVADVCSLLK